MATAAAGCTKKRKMAAASAASAASAGNWAVLPEELLDKIAKRLTLYADRIRLRAVCVSWQSALPETPNQLPRQFPLLMMFPRDPKEGETTYEFFSIVEKKSYFLDFPFEMSNKNFLPTSCYGWLIFEEKLSVGLFNPFTKARIQLPFLSVGLQSFNEYYPRELLKTRVTKVVLSASPSSSDFMTIVLIDFPCQLFISKFGDKRWTLIEDKYLEINDIIFFKQQIITLIFGGEVLIREVVLVDDGHGNPTIIKTSVKQILRPAPGSIYYFAMKFYLQVLVEYDDDLFVITKVFDGVTNPTSRMECSLHKLDWHENSRENIDDAEWSDEIDDAEWSEVKSLGDRVYFPCLSPPSYFSARDFPECKDMLFKPWPAYPQGGGLAHKKCIWITPSPV